MKWSIVSLRNPKSTPFAHGNVSVENDLASSSALGDTKVGNYNLVGNYHLTDSLSVYAKVDNLFGANLQPAPANYDVVGRTYRIGARANL